MAAALGLVVVLSWQYGVRPAFEAAIFRATGWDAKVGTLSPRWWRLVARDVTLMGAAPFAHTPLAKIARLEVELRGSVWAPVPTVVSVDGALVTYLAVGLGPGRLDNLSGDPNRSAGRPTRAQKTSPALRIRNSRFEAFVRLPSAGTRADGQRSLAVRSEQMEAYRESDGRFSARWEAVVLDLVGGATVRVPRISASRQAGKSRLSARDLVVSVPGAGPLLIADALDVESRGATVSLVLHAKPRTARGDARPTEPSSHVDVGSMAGRLDLVFKENLLETALGELRLAEVPLTPLAPALRKAGLSLGAGHADLRARLTPPKAGAEIGTLAGDIELSVAGLDVHHPRLDRTPWRGLQLDVRATGSHSPRARRWEVSAGQITALGFTAGFHGWLALAPAPAGELNVVPPEKTAKACAEALATWPASLRARLQGMIVSGRLGPQGRLRFDARRWEDLELQLKFAPLCKVVAEPTVIGNLGSAAVSPPDATTFVAIKTLPAHVVGAFLTAEDGAFRRHEGFDLEMIRRALAHDFAMGALTKGASTLSQQVVKNLFLGPERTIARKLAELVLTWRLEANLDKDRILELYLNVVELGPGLRGIGPASARYFGKAARDLTPLEAAHLAALLPNPVGFARRFRSGRVDEGWLHKLYDLLGRMQRSGLLTDAALQAARDTPLELRRF